MCHRSPLAYGPTLAAAYPASLADIAHDACSCAITNDLFQSNHAANLDPNGAHEPAQLCSASAAVAACTTTRLPAVGTRTTTVTLTIGGNDAGFASVLASCVWVSVGKANIGRPGHNCAGKPSVYRPLYQRLTALAGYGTATSPDGNPVHSYTSVLAAIHRAAPSAHVYLTGYPRIFQDPTSKDCVVGTAVVNGTYGFYTKVTPQDAAWLDAMATALDTIMALAAKRAGNWASYVDVTRQFTGHGLCTTSAWLNPLDASATLPGQDSRRHHDTARRRAPEPRRPTTRLRCRTGGRRSRRPLSTVIHSGASVGSSPRATCSRRIPRGCIDAPYRRP